MPKTLESRHPDTPMHQHTDARPTVGQPIQSRAPQPILPIPPTGPQQHGLSDGVEAIYLEECSLRFLIRQLLGGSREPHHSTTAPLHHFTTAPLHHCTTPRRPAKSLAAVVAVQPSPAECPAKYRGTPTKASVSHVAESIVVPSYFRSSIERARIRQCG
jgi:hypothetical protein